MSNTLVPINLAAAATEIGCSQSTLRNYIKQGVIRVARTPSGHFVFFEPQIRTARKVFERNNNRR